MMHILSKCDRLIQRNPYSGPITPLAVKFLGSRSLQAYRRFSASLQPQNSHPSLTPIPIQSSPSPMSGFGVDSKKIHK